MGRRMTPRTLLLTGANGMLGRQLRIALADHFHVVATARQAGADGVRALDIADAAAVRSIVADLRPAVIVNSAAIRSLVAQKHRGVWETGRRWPTSIRVLIHATPIETGSLF